MLSQVTTVALGKTVSITYSECVLAALVIRHAKCMRRILLLSVVFLISPHFLPSYKRNEF